MTYQTFSYIVSGLIGACWGSFLNAAYYRAKTHCSLVHEPSFCPSCKTPIKPWYNIPILGWFLTRGRCASCQNPVSFHYPLIEFLVMAIFLGCSWCFVSPIGACLAGALISLYLMGALYDHYYFLLPDVVLNGSVLLALALVILSPEVLGIIATQGAIITAVVGGVVSVVSLLVIKNVGQLFLTRTEELKGRGYIDEKGVTLVYGNGTKEVTTWEEFVFSKVIPQGHVVLNDVTAEPAWHVEVGQQAPYLMMDGSFVIYDGEVRVGDYKVDLSKGVEFKADSLKIHRNAMGMGDIRLVASLGVLIGFNAGLYEALFFACCTGLAHGLYLKRKDRRLPFGPHLMLGAAYVVASKHGWVPAVKSALALLGKH